MDALSRKFAIYDYSPKFRAWPYMQAVGKRKQSYEYFRENIIQRVEASSLGDFTYI